MPRILAAALLVVALAPTAGRAQQVTEIFKCLDANGRPEYTNDRRATANRKCELVSREISVVPANPKPPAGPSQGGASSPAGKAASPAGFPREDSASRASAKDRQRDILERELQQEQELLSKAKRELSAQEAVRSGDERNYARVQERLQKYKDNVEVHEKNVEALRRELSNLAR